MKQLKTDKKEILLFCSGGKLFSELGNLLDPKTFHLSRVDSHKKLIENIEEISPDIVIVDISLIQNTKIDIISYIKNRLSVVKIIVLTTINEIDYAGRTLLQGASFYLMKPVTADAILSAVDKISFDMDRNFQYREFEQQILSDLMAGSPTMEKILRLTQKIAPTSSTVLLGGESGTGKEFFAKIIHRLSKREEGKFVVVNCGAIPDTLFESEMFGHKKGAFTGADRDKRGFVEEAHGGTLFLDEVGELSPAAQVKLLRFIQERTFNRVGDSETRSVNVRIIAATNRDLAERVREGEFREDLYFRLNVFLLKLPPLRMRKETLPGLVRLFVNRKNVELNKNISKFSSTAEAIIASYEYPGNIRELENIIEHAMVLADGDEVTELDLPEFMFDGQLKLTAPKKHRQEIIDNNSIIKLENIEKDYIKKVLNLLNQNYSESALALGISRSTLWRKIKKYKLDGKT